MKSVMLAASFDRGESSIQWTPPDSLETFPLTKQPGWQSNGGEFPGHKSRRSPFVLDCKLNNVGGQLRRIYLLGVFAMHSGRDLEPWGTHGATIEVGSGSGTSWRQHLLSGKHYVDARTGLTQTLENGDGTTLEPLGWTEVNGVRKQVSKLTIDVEHPGNVTDLRFIDLGTPASFVIFDIVLHYANKAVCPFRSGGSTVSLTDLGAAIRIGDRTQFRRATAQLQASLESLPETELDEARGLSLTFLSVISAALVEVGAPRSIHRFQLEAARTFESLSTVADVCKACLSMADDLVAHVISKPVNPGDALIDKALQLVNRNYAKELTDSEMARYVGLSTSHFRHLFRMATGQPFHKYLMSVRLEKARQMLMDHDLGVSEIARSVGFASSAHFTRTFVKRFNVPPSAIRQSARQQIL